MAKRTTLVAAPSILLLLDPTERKSAIDSFREYNGNTELEKTIITILVEPLENWAEMEFQKYGQHEGIEIALKVATRGRDFADKWSDGVSVIPEQIDALESEWRELCELLGFASVDLWGKDDARRNEGRSAGGKGKTGHEEPLTIAINQYLLHCGSNSFTEMLSEMESDAKGRDNLFCDRRKDKSITVKFVSVDSDEIKYSIIGSEEIKSIKTSSLETKMSKLKNKTIT